MRLRALDGLAFTGEGFSRDCISYCVRIGAVSSDRLVLLTTPGLVSFIDPDTNEMIRKIVRRSVYARNALKRAKKIELYGIVATKNARLCCDFILIFF